ncbi:hemagglutinin repeat-containing protein, partial [Gilliamella sp. wkB171]|uniref:hemagglutinin repeat-containing protein n=2 Tax=unclassified Gilliamella TaxID=2685620 RepID=UPI0008132CF4
MNKRLYRVIFNKKRNMQMVVADISKTANGQAKTTTDTQQTAIESIFATLKPISLFVSISLGFVTLTSPVYGSQIVADNQAGRNQQPIVISTANGVTQVNIQTPNNKGVSHNKYKQFDVSQQGAILNNSSKISQTQIAGYVQGNELLNKTGPAKIILNEVNSRNPSQLNGVIEVAGQKAEVIIANPSGITCNGCGFINASRGTLTTGKPIINNGEINGYQVEQGHITVTGKGLDSSGQNYTDLIARTVSINSAIWANEANVITGRNQVSYDTQTITPLDNATDNKPEVSIDVSQLGGMYANSIRMIGTEKGVGVHNAGELGASAGSIVISADGKITNQGAIQAQQSININSVQDINNQNQIYSKQNIKLKSEQTIVNDGSLIAQNNITLDANKINSSKNSRVVSGVNDQGKLTNPGTILASANNINFNGKNSASEKLLLNAKEALNLDNSQTYANHIELFGNSLSLKAAQLQTEQQLDVINSNSIDTSNSTIITKKGITFSSGSIINENSQLISESDITFTANDIKGNDSKLATNQKITMHAADIAMQNANLSAKGAISLSADQINANKLQLITEQELNIGAQNLFTNQANIQAKKAINIKSNNYFADFLQLITEQSLSLNSHYLQLNNSQLNVLGDFNVDSHELQSGSSLWLAGKNITVKSDSINNQSSQQKATGTINYQFNQLNNNNSTLIGQSLTFSGNSLYNQNAKWQSGSNINILATKLFDNKTSIMLSQDQLNIDTQEMVNDEAELFAGGNLTLRTTKLLSNNSVIQSDQAITLTATEQLVANAANLYSQKYMQINSQNIDLTKANVGAKGDIAIIGKQQTYNNAEILSTGQIQFNATTLQANNATIKAEKELTIDAKQFAAFNAAQLVTNQKLTIDAEQIESANSAMYAKSGMKVQTTQLNNQNAKWSSEGTISLTAQQINNKKTTLQSGQLNIETEQLDNSDAIILSGGGLVINAKDIDNTSAQIQTKSGIKINADNALKNANATLITDGAIDVTTDNFINTNAKFWADQFINIHATDVNNEHSVILSNDKIELTATSVNNQNSEIKAKQAINIKTNELASDNAQYVSGGNLDLNSQNLSLNQAKLSSKGDINIDTKQLISDTAEYVTEGNFTLKSQIASLNQAKMTSKGNLNIDNQQALNIKKAVLTSLQYLGVKSGTITSSESSINSVGNLDISTTELIDNNATLMSDNDINIYADKLNTESTELGAQGKINVNAHTLKNSNAKWVANQDMIINSEQIDNAGSQMGSGQSLTINTKQLDNRKAMLSSKGNINITSENVDNTASKLFSNQSININSHYLTNKEAVLKSDDSITINSPEFDNSDAILVAEKAITVISDNLKNNNATIQSQAQITLKANQFDNQSALLLSGLKGITIDAGTLNNQQAKLFTKGDLAINAQDLMNQYAKLVSEKSLTIKANQFNNQNSELQAKASVNIDATTINNQQAKMDSEQDIILNAANNIDNSAASMTANGLINLKASNNINNSYANLLSNNGILLEAVNLYNQAATLKTNGLISIKAQSMDNQQSDYLAENIMLESDHLNNQFAKLNASHYLIINAKDFDNSKANLLADSIYLKTQSFHGDGVIKSQNELSLDLDESFINENEITTNGHLSIRTQKDIINKNKMTAGRQISLESKQLINEKQSEISAGYLALNHQTINNYGLINGDTTVIRTNVLDNLESGRIYADNLAIKASILNNRAQNGVAPVIAARQNFHLGVNTLNNYTHAQLLSLGNFIIGGDLDENLNVTGNADVINNHSANIESHGDLYINANAINNINDHIITEMRKSDEAPEMEEYFIAGGRLEKYSPDEILYRIRSKYFRGKRPQSYGCEKHDKGCWYLWKDIPEYLRPTGALSRIQIKKDGYTSTNSWHYKIIKTKYRTVVLETDPGKITAANNIVIKGQILNNQDSKIVAGKTVNINVQQLNNYSQETISKYVYSGNKIEHWKNDTKDYRATSTPYDKPDEIFNDDSLNSNILDHKIFEQTELKEVPRETVKVENTPTPITVNNDIKEVATKPVQPIHNTDIKLTPNDKKVDKISNIAVPTNKFDNVTAISQKPDNNLQDIITDHINNNTADKTPIKEPESAQADSIMAPIKTISTYDPTITLPDNSLWIVNKYNPSYIVETDPRFTQRKKWLSSDYMLNRLKVDPNSIQKRLGDGYYEQQLIREQIIGLTGNRYLQGYRSDLEQYQALMDAGISFANQYGIVPGVELSAEQMRAITTDMILLMKKTITVDGENIDVLVPQVYIVNRTQLGTDGALISGENVFIKGEQLDNKGLIQAKENVLLNGYNVNNTGSIYGNKVGVTAENDITNYGKLVGDKLVYLSADNDINLLSSTRTQTKARNSLTNIDKTSIIQVNDGNIIIDAGHDIKSQAGWIINSGEQGTTWLQAGHDVQFTTADIEEKFDYRRKKDYRITDEKSVVGTGISAANNVNIIAGNNINAKTVDIEAGNRLNLIADNDIEIGSSTETAFLDEFHKTKSKGFLNKTTSTSHTVIDNTTQKGSMLSGDSVTISAGNNLTVTGSQVVGTHDVNLYADKDITVNAAEESYYRKEETKKKKSGLMSSGGIGVTIGKEKESLKQTDTEQAYVGSVVGSTDGSVNIHAGKNINVEGSDIIAKQNIKMQGENVNIEALDAKTTHKEEYKYQKTGVTVAVSGTASNIYNATQTLQQAKEQTNDKTKALMEIKAGLQAGNAALETGANLQDGVPEASVGINISLGSEKTKRTVNQEQHTVVSSSVAAGRDVSIIATGNGESNSGDINVIGSQVQAGRNATINANHDINIIGQENTFKTDTKEKSSSGSVSVGYNFGGQKNGFNISASGSQSKSREKGNGTDWTESVIEAGNKLTMITGNDANINAGQIKGDSVVADIGHDLNITSQQDSDEYHMKNSSSSVGGSFSLGGTSSINAANSTSKMDSNWKSVTDQSGIFAGKGGYDIKVGNNTDLKGAVIASEAEDTGKNKLDTGTISFTDIENKADYKVSSSSVGVSTIGMPSMPAGYNKKDNEQSITHSAVSQGTIIIRNENEQKQDINELSRDTEHASNELKHIFDKEKEQSKIDQTRLVSEISGETLTMLNTIDRIKATEEAKKAVEDKRQKSDKPLTDKEQQEIYKEAYDKAMNEGMSAMGSNTRQGIDMAINIINGLITGDMTGAVAGALAPKLAT